jgi:ClpP class serine protease
MFVKAVAHNRGVTENAVRNGFGEGRVVGARQAKAEGMVDRITTLDETLARLGVSSAPAAMRAETDISHLALARRDLDLQEVS